MDHEGGTHLRPDARRRLTVEDRALDIPVAAGRARLVLFERGTAKVIASTPGGDVSPARDRKGR